MDISDRKLKKLMEQWTERDIKELAIIQKLIDNDLDEYGNTILDKFPYLVELVPPLIDEKYDGFLDWLNENTVSWFYDDIHRVHFRNEEDKVKFILRWM